MHIYKHVFISLALTCLLVWASGIDDVSLCLVGDPHPDQVLPRRLHQGAGELSVEVSQAYAARQHRRDPVSCPLSGRGGGRGVGVGGEGVCRSLLLLLEEVEEREGRTSAGSRRKVPVVGVAVQSICLGR